MFGCCCFCSFSFNRLFCWRRCRYCCCCSCCFCSVYLNLFIHIWRWKCTYFVDSISLNAFLCYVFQFHFILSLFLPAATHRWLARSLLSDSLPFQMWKYSITTKILQRRKEEWRKLQTRETNDSLQYLAYFLSVIINAELFKNLYSPMQTSIWNFTYRSNKRTNLEEMKVLRSYVVQSCCRYSANCRPARHIVYGENVFQLFAVFTIEWLKHFQRFSRFSMLEVRVFIFFSCCLFHSVAAHKHT